MPAPPQRLSPMNTRLSSLEVAVAIPRHQRLVSQVQQPPRPLVPLGPWPTNETLGENERNPGRSTAHGMDNVSFLWRLTSDHALLPPATDLFGLTNGSAASTSRRPAASSRAGGVGQVGVVGQGRRTGDAPFGLDSPGRPRFFPCFPPSLARSRVGGSSFHIGHMGTCGLSWRPASVCWGDTGLRFARPRGWTSADAVLGEIWVHGGIPYLPPSPAHHHLCRPS